jgi:hypothetical protein
MRFEVFTAVIFRDVTPYRQVEVYRPLAEIYCLHLQGWRIRQTAKRTVLFRSYGVGVDSAGSAASIFRVGE